MASFVTFSNDINLKKYIVNVIFLSTLGQAVVSPVETLFKSMHDVFACYSTPAVTHKPIEAKQYDDFSIVDALKLAFDDPVSKSHFKILDSVFVCMYI